MGSKKKNKKAKKPAVGTPAAGSNNKGAKNAPKTAKNVVSDKNKAKQKEQERLKKEAELRKKQQNERDGKAAHKADSGKAEKKPAKKDEKNKSVKPQKKQNEKPLKSEKIKKEKLPKAEKVKKEKPQKAEKIKKEKAQKPVKPKKEKTKKEKSGETLKQRAEKIREKYGTKKIVAVLISAAAVLLVGVTVIILLAGRNYSVPDYVKNAEYKGRTESDAIAFDMDISKNQQALLVKATKAKGDRRAFDFFVNDKIVMSEYDDPALIEFGSADGNDCVLMFYIIDENGSELYRSLGVEPGRQISSVTFFDEIPYGTHDVTVAVIGYDAKTFKKVGMQTTQIKLEIGV